MSVTPNAEPNWVVFVRSSCTPAITSVAAPAAFVVAGIVIDTGPVGDVGALPSDGKVNEVTGSGAAAVPASVTPFAVAYTF